MPRDDDETRLGPESGRRTPARSGADTGGTSPTTGWLPSSGTIDHGRFPPGTILGGRYRIVGRLGKGGMGEVFRADDLMLGQQVALKFLPPEVDRDPARLTQLHSEVRMARQVSHPNVCRVYDIDKSRGRWDILSRGHAPVLRFWYRTSPRELTPIAPGAWASLLNDPPLVLSGMTTVVVDERGRLIELVAVPPQRDTSMEADAAVDWAPLFAAAGLPMTDFAPVAPQWTPRVFAESRSAWEGSMPGFPDARLRVEAASYGGRPVSFQVVWPWTVPSRMEQPTPSTLTRVLSVGGSLLLILLMVGAVALVRYNLKSGRADREGAARLSVFLIAVWIVAWALRHLRLRRAAGACAQPPHRHRHHRAAVRRDRPLGRQRRSDLGDRRFRRAARRSPPLRLCPVRREGRAYETGPFFSRRRTCRRIGVPSSSNFSRSRLIRYR